MWRRTVLLGAAWTLVACAASSAPPAYHAAAAVRRDMITAAEIVAARVADAYEAVARLRPEFLRRRGRVVGTMAAQPNVMVYLDELPYGGLETLRHIPLERVRLIRYLSPSDADMRWGGSHPTGAILVTTLR